MLSKNFYEKGNKVLKNLKIKTKKVEENKDVIEAENFSAILKDEKLL